jgi:hypothetical protein
MSKMRIEINEEDIALGIPASPYGCAIVMALRRKFPLFEATVTGDAFGGHIASLHELVGGLQPAPVLRVKLHLSKNASKAIKQFDTVGVMVPATYEGTVLFDERAA